MSVRILRPGLLTSLQDQGRYGLQHLGIVPCGAMDPVAHRLANALVGNPATCSTLECTVLGPELVFGRDSRVDAHPADLEAVGPHPPVEHQHHTRGRRAKANEFGPIGGALLDLIRRSQSDRALLSIAWLWVEDALERFVSAPPPLKKLKIWVDSRRKKEGQREHRLRHAVWLR